MFNGARAGVIEAERRGRIGAVTRVVCAAALPLVLQLAMPSCSPSGGTPSTEPTPADGPYHDSATTTAEVNRLAGQFPVHAQALSIGRSWEGRDIPALSISATSADPDRKPNIYIVAGMHAREWIGVEVALGFARHLLDGSGPDPAAAQEAQLALQQARFYVVPTLNPDGQDYAFRAERSWYKNRRDNRDGTWGVNLNNNFPLGWECTDVYPASPSPISSSERYRGTEPFSEPESQAIRDFMSSHPPAGLIDYHSRGAIIYPSLPRVVSERDVELWHTVQPEMARRMSAVSGRVYAIPESNRAFQVGESPDPSQCAMLGQLLNWARDRFEASACLIELPPGPSDSDLTLTPSEVDVIIAEQVRAILYFAAYVAQGAASGVPVSASARSDTVRSLPQGTERLARKARAPVLAEWSSIEDRAPKAPPAKSRRRLTSN